MLKTLPLAVALLLLAGQQACLAARSGAAFERVQELDTTYNVLIRTGAKRPTPDGKGEVQLGAMLDRNGKPILDGNGNPRQANNPDFTSYVKVNGRIHSAVQVETTPAMWFVMGIDQRKDGHLRVDTLSTVDLSAWEGSTRPCAGVITPWDTHMAGEETYPNVRTIANDLAANRNPSSIVRELMSYYGIYLDSTITAAGRAAYNALGLTVLPLNEYNAEVGKYLKPYMYGHVAEIRMFKGEGSFTKHMAMGRASWELPYVMPNERTVYLSDDAGSSGGWTKFVAHKKRDFSKGTLYAAKLTQTNEDDAPSGKWKVDWVKLADVDADIILAQAKRPITEFSFNHIFEYEAPNADGTCKTEGFKHVMWDSGRECLKLNTSTPNVEMLAAALETRRFITYQGASSQFSKFEGAAYAPEYNKFYFSISTQSNAMLTKSPTWDLGTTDDARVKRNLCGCVYEADVDESNNYNAYFIQERVCGREDPETGCDLTLPANPDNLSYMEGYDWLIISEDGSRDQDFLWAHNVKTSETILLNAAESGAEVAAGWWHDKLSGYSYITANHQSARLSTGAPIGYLGPFKVKEKQVTFKPHVPLGANYVNPYSPHNLGQDGEETSP